MRTYSIPIDSGKPTTQQQTSSMGPVEGPRTFYRGYTYTVTQEGREWVWRVYEELGDDGILLKVGSVVSGDPTSAVQSAKDWIDNYIEELGALQPGYNEDDEVDSSPEEEKEEEKEKEKEKDPLDPGVSGEFILIGALAFLALAVVFIFDGED